MVKCHLFTSRSRLLGSRDIESDSEDDAATRKRPAASDEEKVRPGKELNSSDESDAESRSYGGRTSDEDELGPSRESDLPKGKAAKKAENRQSRKSKDAAMKEIYSESSRMLRESKVTNFKGLRRLQNLLTKDLLILLARYDLCFAFLGKANRPDRSEVIPLNFNSN